MYTFIVTLILIVSVLLAIIVLVQNSKGGGLAANFSAPNQIMGVRRTTDFLEKATWTLAAALVVLSLIATISIKSLKSNEGAGQAGGLNTEINGQPTQQQAANTTTAGTQAPAEGGAQQ
ncbi:MAG: preprotein translocase subunit SecG [Bacteroidales bacterium]|nr:preprotein translocase subunit SecG [Bacteroidales bacterium]